MTESLEMVTVRVRVYNTEITILIKTSISLLDVIPAVLMHSIIPANY